MSITGCGNSSILNTITSIEVERGPVYEATVKDALGRTATQETGKNIYNFSIKPVYPIVVSGGWIDIDGDGYQSIQDIPLDINMTSYSNVVTPITTICTHKDKIKREELENKLAEQLGVDVAELKKVPSKAVPEVAVLNNAIFKEVKENNTSITDRFNYETIIDNNSNFDELMNEYDTIKVIAQSPEGMTNGIFDAKKLEQHIVSLNSDIFTNFSNDSLMVYAGVDFEVKENATVELNSTVNLDTNESRIIKYRWFQIDNNITTVTINNANSSNATFQAPDIDNDIELEFQFEVIVNNKKISFDRIKVKIFNTLPNWETHQANSSHTGYVPTTLHTTDFKKLWEKEFSLEIDPIISNDGIIYITDGEWYGNNSNSLYAIDEKNGSILWSNEIDYFFLFSQPMVRDDILILTSFNYNDAYIWKFNAKTGEQISKELFNTQFDQYLFPTIIDNTDEQINISNSIDNPISTELGYSYRKTQIIGSNNNIIRFDSEENYGEKELICFNSISNSIKWTSENLYGTYPAISNGKIYAASLEPLRLDVLDEEDGSILWSWTSEDLLTTPFYYNIVVTDNLVFLSSDTATYAISLETNKEVWSYPRAGTLSISSNKNLYIVTGHEQNDKKLVAISLKLNDKNYKTNTDETTSITESSIISGSVTLQINIGNTDNKTNSIDFETGVNVWNLNSNFNNDNITYKDDKSNNIVEQDHNEAVGEFYGDVASSVAGEFSIERDLESDIAQGVFKPNFKK